MYLSLIELETQLNRCGVARNFIMWLITEIATLFMSELQLPQTVSMGLCVCVFFSVCCLFFLLLLFGFGFTKCSFQIEVFKYGIKLQTRTATQQWIVCMARTKWDTKLKLSKLYLLQASEFKLRATIAFCPFRYMLFLPLCISLSMCVERIQFFRFL